MLILYNIAWILCLPFMILVLIARIILGKEDIMRIKERFGLPSAVRSTKGIIWIHAASVGESRVAITLTRHFKIKYPKHRILITTGTITSANIVRSFASSRIVHQFLPMDHPLFVWLFLRNWKPDLGIFVESELWPNLVFMGARFCPLILVNAIISENSFKNWSKCKSFVKTMLQKFRYILCQSTIDAQKYKTLGADAKFIGNLKYAGAKLDVNLSHLNVLREMVGQRPIFLAASTHPGDDEIMVLTHIQIKKEYPDILTIIVPRHIARATDIKEMVLRKGLSCAMRSRKEYIAKNTDIYIADTMGELGMLFSIAKVSFIAGSFKNGGHNPIEAAYFNTHIIFGPDMSNFREISEEFLQNKAAIQIKDLGELVKCLEKIFAGNVSSHSSESISILKNHDSVMEKYLEYIEECLTLDKKHKYTKREAIEQILEMRKENNLGGLTIKELRDEGKKY